MKVYFVHNESDSQVFLEGSHVFSTFQKAKDFIFEWARDYGNHMVMLEDEGNEEFSYFCLTAHEEDCPEDLTFFIIEEFEVE